jgi:hypothetical protein
LKLVKPTHGHGALSRTGRKKGARNAVSRTFREVSEAIMSDPDVVAMLKRRVLLELAGKKRNPLPLVAVLGAACSGDKAKERDARGAISFAVQIVSGRGVVSKVEGDAARALPGADDGLPGEARVIERGGSAPSAPRKDPW